MVIQNPMLVEMIRFFLGLDQHYQKTMGRMNRSKEDGAYWHTITGDMLNFSGDTKVTEYVETIPYFVINFWDKKLTKISLFKDISWNQKKNFEKIFFFPMVFWARKLVETIQLFFHCCHHTSEENTAFEMIFWVRKTWKRQKFGNIS